MIIKSFSFGGRTYPHYQVVNNRFHISKDSIVATFPYRETIYDMFIVQDEGLIINSIVSSSYNNEKLTIETKNASVVNDNLILND